MPEGKTQKSKKGKNRRKNRNLIAKHWNFRHPVNMARRALRVFKHVRKFQGDGPAQSAMDRFVAQHSINCGACKLTLQAQVRRLVQS